MAQPTCRASGTTGPLKDSATSAALAPRGSRAQPLRNLRSDNFIHADRSVADGLDDPPGGVQQLNRIAPVVERHRQPRLLGFGLATEGAGTLQSTAEVIRAASRRCGAPLRVSSTSGRSDP